MHNYKKIYREIYSQTDISDYEKEAEIDFVIEIYTNLKPQDFILGKQINSKQNELIKNALQEHVQTGRPLQYITGEAFFAGKRYFVNKNTLIPRPETEFLAQACINNCKYQNPKILDIGTGSGCIAIELAINIPNSEITACDICQEVVYTASQNALRHNVSNKINFIKSNLFENIKEKFDIIVSNPPYISYSDKNEVDNNVLLFEPQTALFADDDGLFFYKEIIEKSTKYLNKSGLLAFEIGWKQADIIKQMLIDKGFINIKLTQDLDGINRVITGNYK